MTNSVIECLMNRRSIRRFKTDRIDEETLGTILTAGTRAATAGNLQMYTFLVLDEKEKLALFQEEFEQIIQNPPLIIIALLDLYRIKRWFEINDSKPVILNRPAYFMLGFWDALIALHNVVIAAESMGLGACYYGSILEFDIRKHFGTPEYVFPAGMVCMGYPAGDSRLSQRLPLEAVVHRNHYQCFSDNKIKEFYRERERVWEAVSEKRKRSPEDQGIRSIPQALAIQRFSDSVTRKRSEGILRNLRNADFTFDLDTIAESAQE